jgi:hypothetical protein
MAARKPKTSDSTLDGFVVGQPAPRTVHRAFVGGTTPEFLTVVEEPVPGVGGDVVIFEGDVVTESTLAVLGLS